MKNFEMHCPVDGTSALQPKFEHTASSAGTIIAFPGQHDAWTGQPVSDNHQIATPSHNATSRVRARINETEMVQSLRYGSAQGCAYNRIAPWQAVTAGLLFSVVAFASILMGL